MSVEEPPGSTDPTEPRPVRPRQSLASSWSSPLVVVVAVIGLIAVVGLIVVTRQSSTSGRPSAAVTTTSTDASPAPVVTGAHPTGTVPVGDYGPFCAEIRKESGPNASAVTPANLGSVMARLDFDKLLAVAPDGLKPPMKVLRDTKAGVVALLGQVKSYSDIQPADLPAGFATALVTVETAASQKCAAGAH